MNVFVKFNLFVKGHSEGSNHRAIFNLRIFREIVKISSSLLMFSSLILFILMVLVLETKLCALISSSRLSRQKLETFCFIPTM